MLLFYLKKIWSNLYARIGVLVFASLIVFSLIYQVRMNIFIFFDRLSSGASFDDPYSWSGEPYGFSEDAEAASRLYQNGLYELVELAYDIYNYDIEGDIVPETTDLGENWQKHLEPQSIELVQALVADMRLFCKPPYEAQTARKKWELRKKLEQRHRKQSTSPNPFGFAVTSDNIASLRDQLYEINYNNLKVALEKKPDAYAVLTLHDTVLSGLCHPHRGLETWQSAIAYMEYRQEKSFYYQYFEENVKEKKPVPPPEELAQKAAFALAKDKQYQKYIKILFLKDRAMSENLEARLLRVKANYMLNQDPVYLKEYIRLLLEKSRQSSREQAKAIFETLYQLEFKGYDQNPLYVYALAETAYRSHQFQKARSLVNHIIKEKIYHQVIDYKRAARLSLLVELQGY